MALPITVIAGYLGAGKTTLVNHLLRHADGVRLAVLVNEFGVLPIDQDLIVAQDETVISLAGGCVCCSYGNDLTLALMDLAKLDPQPDHVVLEASGVALPGAVAASVSLLADYAMDGVVILADAETVRAQARDIYIGDTIDRQLGDADLVVLNKADLVGPRDLVATVEWLGDKAPSAAVVTTSHGKVPPATVLQSFLGRDRSAAGPVHRADLFETVSLAVAEPVDPHALARSLADGGLSLVRAKGFVRPAGGGAPVAIQVVGRRWTVSPAAETAPLGLVAIGYRASVDAARLAAIVAAAGRREG